MKTKQTNDNALHEIFKPANSFSLPEDFNRQIMKEISRIQQKREKRNLWIISLISLFLFTGTMVALKYYLDWNLIAFLGTTINQTKSFVFPDFSFLLPILIGVAGLFWLDYRLRKRFSQSSHSS